jgi:hypothetical protein
MQSPSRMTIQGGSGVLRKESVVACGGSKGPARKSISAPLMFSLRCWHHVLRTAALSFRTENGAIATR